MTNPATPPSEVGWQFVSQYYTFVNKQPNRLHCFYTKNSAFVHGTEGEDEQTCYGQHEIHEKIQGIGFQDCKVYIHSVDSQSSANNGIVIQAIGEMSNNNAPWKKFAQTFFLAEQPNGYFVLNDIFRYLKEETDEDAEEDEAAGAVAAGVVDEPVVPEPAPGVENNYHPNPQQQARADPPPAIEPTLAPVEVAAEPAPATNGNGVHHDVPASPEAAPVEPTPEPAEEPAAAPAPVEAPAPEEPAPEPAAAEPTPAAAEEPTAEPTPAAPTPAPAPAPAAAELVATPAPAPPKPAAPEKPKTWANLAASKAGAWGSALATEAKGVSAAAAPSPAPPAPRPSAPASRAPPSGAQAENSGLAAAQSLTTAQCFVKAVVETIDAGTLRAVLTARFGPIKELEIVRSKACAFLEFEKLDSAKKAIIASLPQHMGGEGGVRIAEGADPAVPNFSRDAPRIIIETRKERGDRPPPKPRGGAPNGDRGSFRGGPGRGRGAPRGAAPAGPK
ncbi:hypothetical protein DL93DRAFT_2232761 [Clavulina sp. PMI_390]|nr:hypothetical protein DL93DRAFT_2232761 [Clavulina sp. PMI_390]